MAGASPIRMINPPIAGLYNVQLSGYINAPYYQGVSRYVPQCARMTIKFCKSRPPSAPARQWTETQAVDFARKNPGTALYLKPRRHKGPVMVCEYLSGHREWKPLARMNCEEIGWWLTWYTERRGDPVMRHLKTVKSYAPSTQGIWNPFLNQPPRWSTQEFPSQDDSVFKRDRPSATEQLLRHAAAQGIKWEKQEATTANGTTVPRDYPRKVENISSLWPKMRGGTGEGFDNPAP